MNEKHIVTIKISFEEYNELIRNFAPDSSLYHQKEWLTAITADTNMTIFGLKTETSDHRLIALTPVIEKRKFTFTLFGAPLRGSFTEFSGPVFANELSPELKERALLSQHQFLKSKRASYIECGMKGPESDETFTIFSTLKYEFAKNETLVLDLSLGADSVWDGFKGRARNMIRKAEKNNVLVNPVELTGGTLKQYYSMLDNTFKRQGINTPHPFSLFENMSNQLSPNGWLRCFWATHDGDVVAAAIFLLHGDRMMYLSGTSTPEGAKLASNNLIQWEAIKFAISAGIKEYDMGGTGNAAIDKFKKSFGGTPSYHRRWVYKSIIIKLLEGIYFRLIKFGLLKPY